MSASLNSAIEYADAHGSALIAGDESEVPMTQASAEVRSVCGSNAAESVGSVAGLNFPSLDGAICYGSKARAVTGVIS